MTVYENEICRKNLVLVCKEGLLFRNGEQVLQCMEVLVGVFFVSCK